MVRKDKKVLFSHSCIWGPPKAPLLRATQGRNQLLKKYHKRWNPDAAFQGGEGDSDSFCPDYVSHAPGKLSHQQLINISDISESKQNPKVRKHYYTLGLQFLQEAAVCLIQQFSDFDLGWPTSAPFHLRNFLGLGLFSVSRPAPFPSNCLNPGWDLLC